MSEESTSDIEEETFGRALWDRRAKFDKDRLPQWGGKTLTINEQPKCWTSLKSVKDYHAEELRKSERVIKTNLNKRTKRLFQLPTKAASKPFHRLFESGRKKTDSQTQAAIGNPQRKNVNSTTDAIKATKVKSKIGQTQGHNASTSGKEEGNTSGIRASRMARVEQHLRDKIARLQSSRGEQEAFIFKVKRDQQRQLRARSNRTSKNGKHGPFRNLVVENIWMNDAKEECVAYWKKIDKLKADIESEESVQKQLALYKSWPHPPSTNQTPAARQKRNFDRASNRRNHQRRVAHRREKQAREQHERIKLLQASLLHQQQKAEKSVAASRVFVVMLLITSTLKLDRLMKFSIEERERMKNSIQSAIVIQRYWKRTKATVHGRKYRIALQRVRRFCRTTMLSRRVQRKYKSAEVILWFLTQENSDFIKVMKNYRYLVIQAQRLWRGFCTISRARVRTAIMLLEQVEKNKLNRERDTKVREMEAKAKLVQEDLKELFDPLVLDSRTSLPREGRRKSTLGSSAQSAARGTRALTSSMATMRLDFIANGIRSRKSTVKSVNFATLLTAPQTACKIGGESVQVNRVSKTVKAAVVSKFLREERLKFRSSYQVGGNNKSHFGQQEFTNLSVGDARELLLQPREEEMSSKRLKDGETSQRRVPQGLLFFTKLDNNTLNQLMEHGRNLAQKSRNVKNKTFMTT